VQVDAARRNGACRTAVTGPVVRPAFSTADRNREAARRSLGADQADRVVLVVGGSWGAGRLLPTVQAIAAAGRFRVVAVSGRNERLRCRLLRVPGVTAFGWVEDISPLVAAADVMIENAGGLTSFEAMAAGVPVVSFRPIPGHGRRNAVRMEHAGVSFYARTDQEMLAAVLSLTDDCPLRRRLTRCASAIFNGDAAEDILALATAEGAQPVPPRHQRAQLRVPV
jgi:processive 1,2-diacylglycerol beta-glucosyltransferase